MKQEENSRPAEEKTRPFQKIRLKNRTGFNTLGMRTLYRALYPYFHCTVRIPPELQDSEEPVVFIANHYNVFGPISFVLSMPLISRIWINEELVNRESAEISLRPGMKRMLPFLGERQIAWLCRKIAALTVYVLTRVGMIPVDRHQPSKLISTMRQSISALEEGRNLLIFPETGQPEYSLTSVTPFFSGFAMLGRLYHRKTGRALRFCPCYIDEQHHRIRLGELTVYNPEADPSAETERVSEELNSRIRAMAAENRGLEKKKAEERSMPVRRTILFFCNLIRLLLLIPLITMLSLPNPGMILLFYLISEGLRILFNAVCSAYPSSNRVSFLLSHGIGILTDLSVVIYLAGSYPTLSWLAAAIALNGAVILFSNVKTIARYRRCAGVNYFDTLAGNLIFAICLQQILSIPLNRLATGVLALAAAVFLAFSAGFSLAFNTRIGREEEERGGEETDGAPSEA